MYNAHISNVDLVFADTLWNILRGQVNKNIAIKHLRIQYTLQNVIDSVATRKTT